MVMSEMCSIGKEIPNVRVCDDDLVWKNYYFKKLNEWKSNVEKEHAERVQWYSNEKERNYYLNTYFNIKLDLTKLEQVTTNFKQELIHIMKCAHEQADQQLHSRKKWIDSISLNVNNQELKESPFRFFTLNEIENILTTFNTVKKVVVIGSKQVGKTSLLITATSGEFPHEYIPPIFDNYSPGVIHWQDYPQFSFWDTRDGEDYARLRPLSYEHCDLFLLCFSCVDIHSFHETVEPFIPEIRKFISVTQTLDLEPVPLILVATKTDARDTNSILRKNLLLHHHEYPISMEEGMSLAKKLGCLTYIETSAIEKGNLSNFTTLLGKCLSIPITQRLRNQVDNSNRSPRKCDIQ
ncbi:hypothetical protein C9374_007863 [Naegleria lovaniensis]|uniref:Rho family small GTPase n=1 Tax=Naegleria lovaniensis TaxID=51637 RepID=A0AA88KGL1_NAELO|nr:uncharacterized protein C9374_007863 [Naegleria lovaniensis]KAG2378715.1 hypothetical protein C9374_007863 [Naegleria lovaniensis]